MPADSRLALCAATKADVIRGRSKPWRPAVPGDEADAQERFIPPPLRRQPALIHRDVVDVYKSQPFDERFAEGVAIGAPCSVAKTANGQMWMKRARVWCNACGTKALFEFLEHTLGLDSAGSDTQPDHARSAMLRECPDAIERQIERSGRKRSLQRRVHVLPLRFRDVAQEANGEMEILALDPFDPGSDTRARFQSFAEALNQLRDCQSARLIEIDGNEQSPRSNAVRRGIQSPTLSPQ